MTAIQFNDPDIFTALASALSRADFRGEVSNDSALRTAMSTDNSVYQILPDLVVAPHDAHDVVTCMRVLERREFERIPLTVRGGGTGTNGQSLNRGVILDMRRHMNRLLSVDTEGQWADVEPGIVLDDLNEQLSSLGLFFAPETSTSTRCAVGGMVSTDASGKGSRVYGKTSDNLLGVEIARGQGLISSLGPAPDWATPMLQAAEVAARAGRAAFIANTPRVNRRFTGYDLQRACPEGGDFEWWRLFPGSEGTLGPITRIRVKLRPVPKHKRLVVAGFSSFRASLAAAVPLLADDPTAIEVLDERVQCLAEEAGLLGHLPQGLRPKDGEAFAYTFVEFNGDDSEELEAHVLSCEARLRSLPGIRAVHVATCANEIRELWMIRSASVGLLGKIDGRARPVSFVEDCVVPPEELPTFLDAFLRILNRHDLFFGIYGHVDVGCMHIRPALNIDAQEDRERLVQVSDEIFELVNLHGGIFWGEHGKGVRGAYLENWIKPEAYAALRNVKTAFDPAGRFNPGKLVATDTPVMGIASTPFRKFNAPEGDALEKAFRCNGNAQCLSYVASTEMCPSFKATKDIRHSPKGRADALRAWHEDRRTGQETMNETDLINALDTCLGCKACASSCPVQVDIPSMRAAFYADLYSRKTRPMDDRAMMLTECLSPWMLRCTLVMRLGWPLARRIAERILKLNDLPAQIARTLPAKARVSVQELKAGTLPQNTVLIWMDWFSALFDEQTQLDVYQGLSALGYSPRFAPVLPAGKVTGDLGNLKAFYGMAQSLTEALQLGKATRMPMIGLDPAFVMALRQDYPKRGLTVPNVLLPQEFLAAEIRAGVSLPQISGGSLSLFTHCTESTGAPAAVKDWQEVFTALGQEVNTPDVGCCGMAGMFGHKQRHQEMSRKLFGISWREHLNKATDAVATGFSCRCQAERLGGRGLRHPLGLIAERLK